jgi:glyoxylase-like metal-dependent hydrolase (beta-lactamase superfamily II)
MTLEIKEFFDKPSFTYSYVIWDSESGKAAIIDPVLDYDPAAGRWGTAAADGLIAFINGENLALEYIFETHVHADHLTSAPYIREILGGQVCIGKHVVAVQETFKDLFNWGADYVPDGSQFDRLLGDGEVLPLGGFAIRIMHTPGHTPACVTYIIEDAAFVGDTLFMPDFGTARADFPGGDARILYHSLKNILDLPDHTRLFMCHDYAPGDRDFEYLTCVAAQKAGNIHIHDGVSEDEYVAMRAGRDAQLSVPKQILYAVQVNMWAGMFPKAEENGVQYLKIPLNQL